MTNLSYDKSIKVGDIVTSCFSCYWEVIQIIVIIPYTSGFLQGTTPFPFLVGKEILKYDGTMASKGAIRTESWDVSHSIKITEEFIREQYNHELTLSDIKKDNLFKLIKTK